MIGIIKLLWSIWIILPSITSWLYPWIEKSDFIGDILSIYRILGGLETKFNIDYWMGGILAKLAKYRFRTNKLVKKSNVKRCAEQRRKPVKISKIYRIYRRIYRIYRRIYRIYRRILGYIGYVGEYIGYVSEYIDDILGNYWRFFWKLFYFILRFILFLFFILNLYYHFIFNYFLYLSYLYMACSYLQSILLKLHVLVWILSSIRWVSFI